MKCKASVLLFQLYKISCTLLTVLLKLLYTGLASHSYIACIHASLGCFSGSKAVEAYKLQILWKLFSLYLY